MVELVKKEIIFNDEEKKVLGGVKGVMVFLKDGKEVDDKEADSSILYIYDEDGNNIRRIYGEV